MRTFIRYAGALTAIAGLLVIALYAIAGIQASTSQAGPPPQAILPPRSSFGTTEQNNASAYMESYGYRVNALGNPNRADGNLDTDSVVMLMPVQSPQFDPDSRDMGDPETKKQVLLGFTACERFFYDMTQIAVGLQRGPYIIMFPASIENVRAWKDGRLSAEDFWAEVERKVTVIDAKTWKTVYENSFLHKDFSGSSRLNEALPPSVEQPGKNQVQITLQPSTVYLPPGGDAALIATLTDSVLRPITGTSVEFSYTLQDEDEQPIATVATGADGVARARFTAPTHAISDLSVSAAVAGRPYKATVPINAGPPVTGTAALDAASAALRLQDFNILDAFYDQAKGEAGVVAEIASPHLDGNTRSQILTIAGTLFAVYPQAATAEPTLVYRSQGTSIKLLFRVNRPDWEAWTGGSISEAQLWERIPLDKVVDALTGQPVGRRDFLSKSFGAAPEPAGIETRKSVQSRLASESWGDQLYTGEFSVPIGANANAFTVEEQTAGAGFAVYAQADPTSPLYSSSGDGDGGKLRGLDLTAGQYILSIEGGSAPATVRLAYVERMVDVERGGAR